MEDKDTTYSSIWLFRKKGKKWEGTKDPIANIKNFRQVRGKYFSEFNPMIAESIINFWSKKGDIILSIDGKRFADTALLKKYLGYKNWNDSISFKILREDEEVEIDFVIEYEEEKK